MRNLLLYNIKNIFSKVAKLFFATTVLLALILPDNTLANNEKEKSIYQLQAEVLYNFSEHVKWIGDGIKVKKICIIDDNPVIQYINMLAKNRDNIIIIRKYENDYLDECNILFVNKIYQGYLKRLLLRVKNKPILTISDIDGFIKDGGFVEFILRNNRVEFLINGKALNSSNIEISRDIVSISDIVE